MTSPRAQFGETLESLRVDVDALGQMAQDAVVGAVTALIGEDRAAAERVIAGDDRIDDLGAALEERTYELMAQQAPVAGDLRLLVSALRVMSDYEKVGNRAVAVAKTALAVWERPPDVVALLGRMGDLCLELLGAARGAWMTLDVTVALSLERRDSLLDSAYSELVSHLLGLDGPGAAMVALHAHGAGRNIERIADHAVIVGQRVSYLVSGGTRTVAAEIR